MVVSGRNDGQVWKAAKALGAATAPLIEIGAEVFGPAPAPISRIRGRARARLLVKAPKGAPLQAALRRWREAKGRGARAPPALAARFANLRDKYGKHYDKILQELATHGLDRPRQALAAATRAPVLSQRLVQAQFLPSDSPEIARHLAFRDALRERVLAGAGAKGSPRVREFFECGVDGFACALEAPLGSGAQGARTDLARGGEAPGPEGGAAERGLQQRGV